MTTDSCGRPRRPRRWRPAGVDGGRVPGGRPADRRPACEATGTTNTSYDPCWPERYSYAARQEVAGPVRRAGERTATSGPDALELPLRAGDATSSRRPGMEKLDSLVRQRPAPDPQGVPPDGPGPAATTPAEPDKYVADRGMDLDARRARRSVQYLAAQHGRPAGGVRGVRSIDPTRRTCGRTRPATAVRGLPLRYQRRHQRASGGGSLTQGAGGGGGAGAPAASGAGQAAGGGTRRSRPR